MNGPKQEVGALAKATRQQTSAPLSARHLAAFARVPIPRMFVATETEAAVNCVRPGWRAIGTRRATPPAAFAYLVARSGILTDKANATHQETIKQRMIVYNAVAPRLNEAYCFLAFVGPWRSLTPQGII